MRVTIYCRVSTDAQERDGTSLDTQERACIEYCRQQGWQVADIVREAASGYTLDRPGMERLRQQVRHGGSDGVLAYAVDRLSRNQNHIGVLFDEIAGAGAKLDFVTEKFEDTAIGRFILAARAFIAEIEREKIAERTMRGKAERARSGRLPQGNGKGCYGYRYSTETGRREIDEAQASVVKRIFQRYLETRSFSAVSNELNEAAVPSFSAGRWYPLTIRRVLTNESYTGTFTYRRSKRVWRRSGVTGKRRSIVEQRPPEDWILIEGASPRIIEQHIWDRVHLVISDPERIHHRITASNYLLKGRIKCAVCGSGIVGQTLRTKGHDYRYYRCRHVYDRNTGHSCSARYIRADKLETVIWRETIQVLSQPELVLDELRRLSAVAVDTGDADRIEHELQAVIERQRRLVRLFAGGEGDESLVQEEAGKLRRQRYSLEEQLRGLTQRPVPVSEATSLKAVCEALLKHLDVADDEDRIAALEALQVTAQAASNRVTITGVIPYDAPEFITQPSRIRCSFNGSAPVAATRNGPMACLRQRSGVHA